MTLIIGIHLLFCVNIYLLKKTALTGTVRKTKRGMPDLKTKLKVGEVQSANTKIMMAFKWLDRREVFKLSSLYDYSLANTNKSNRMSGEIIKKLKCVINYNNCMGSIDKCDMLISSVECVKKTTKW